MPITDGPTKPRMCHDERFLNLGIRDLPFTLDYLSDLPRYVGRGHFQTVCDDKSGHDHLMLTPSSRTMFGLRWEGCILFMPRYRLAGRQARMSTIPPVWWPPAILVH